MAVRCALLLLLPLLIAGSAAIAVVGHFPAYVELAEALNASYFSLPTEKWGLLDDAQRWALNREFLDRCIERKEPIRLATPFLQVRAGSYTEKELHYLYSSGYHTLIHNTVFTLGVESVSRRNARHPTE